MVGLTLALSNLLASQDNQRRAIGANLAREGIEVIRNVRDSNWLKRDLNQAHSNGTYINQLYSWDDLIDADGLAIGYDFQIRAVPGSILTYQLVDPGATITDISNCSASATKVCRVKFDPTTGIYGGSTGNLTLFDRLITIQNICWTDLSNSEITADPGVSCGAGTEKVGMLVISSVRYITSPGPNQIIHDIVAKEKLYNWR